MAASILFLDLRGIHDEREVLRFRDFKQPYASARCLLEGCNPYSEDDTRRAFIAAGGVDNDQEVFQPFSALYPPFSFALLAPLAALPYHAAETAWLALIAVSFPCAVLCIAELTLGYAALGPLLALCLFTVSSTILLMLGQVSGPVIAFLVIGLYCLLRQRAVALGIALLTIAVVLKPHDAALPIGYLLFAGARLRRSFYAITAAALIAAAAGTLWCAHHPASAHWLADLRANLHGNSSSGNVNDPKRGSIEAVNMANLAPLFAVLTPDLPLAGAVAVLLSLGLLGWWAWTALRMENSLPKHLLALASMSAIMLLPIYHRQYDTRALLLLFPAAAVLLAWRRSWGLPALAMLLLTTFLTAHQLLNKLTLTRHASIHSAGPWRTLAFYRPLPEIELAAAVFFTAAFHAYLRAPGSRPGLAEGSKPQTAAS